MLTNLSIAIFKAFGTKYGRIMIHFAEQFLCLFLKPCLHGGSLTLQSGYQGRVTINPAWLNRRGYVSHHTNMASEAVIITTKPPARGDFDP